MLCVEAPVLADRVYAIPEQLGILVMSAGTAVVAYAFKMSTMSSRSTDRSENPLVVVRLLFLFFFLVVRQVFVLNLNKVLGVCFLPIEAVLKGRFRVLYGWYCGRRCFYGYGINVLNTVFV